MEERGREVDNTECERKEGRGGERRKGSRQERMKGMERVREGREEEQMDGRGQVKRKQKVIKLTGLEIVSGACE